MICYSLTGDSNSSLFLYNLESNLENCSNFTKKELNSKITAIAFDFKKILVALDNSKINIYELVDNINFDD